MELQFTCDRGLTTERGVEDAVRAFGPDHCQQIAPWPVSAFEDESRHGQILVLASAATCPGCGGTGHALTDETVYVVPDPDPEAT